MSQLTIFLSKVIGINLIVLSLAMLNGRSPRDSSPDFVHYHPAWLVAGLLALVVSLLLIRLHNIWSGRVLPVLVTLVGWLLLLISVLLLFLAPEGLADTVYIIHLRAMYHTYAAILLVLGAYMTYAGFKAKVHATKNAVQAVGI